MSPFALGRRRSASRAARTPRARRASRGPGGAAARRSGRPRLRSGAPGGRPSSRLRVARAVAIARSFAIRALSACARSTFALITSSFATVPRLEARLRLLQEVLGEGPPVGQILAMALGHEQGVVGLRGQGRGLVAELRQGELGRPQVRGRHVAGQAQLGGKGKGQAEAEVLAGGGAAASGSFAAARGSPRTWDRAAPSPRRRGRAPAPPAPTTPRWPGCRPGPPPRLPGARRARRPRRPRPPATAPRRWPRRTTRKRTTNAWTTPGLPGRTEKSAGHEGPGANRQAGFRRAGNDRGRRPRTSARAAGPVRLSLCRRRAGEWLPGEHPARR